MRVVVHENYVCNKRYTILSFVSFAIHLHSSNVSVKPENLENYFGPDIRHSLSKADILFCNSGVESKLSLMDTSKQAFR